MRTESDVSSTSTLSSRLVLVWAYCATLLLLMSCASVPDSNPPRFYLCMQNLRVVRGIEDTSGSIDRIEVVLTGAGARDLQLFSKKHFGETVHVFSGESEVFEMAMLSIMRGGRIDIRPPAGRGHEVLDILRTPPQAPCGSAARSGMGSTVRPVRFDSSPVFLGTSVADL